MSIGDGVGWTDTINPPQTTAEFGNENTIIGDFEIVAIDKIIVDNEEIIFTQGSNITLRAGQFIDFIPENGKDISMENGAEIECIIDECMPPELQSEEVPTISRVSNDDFLIINHSTKNKDKSLSILPNPSKGIIKIQLINLKNYKELIVTDINGRVIESIILDNHTNSYRLDVSEKGKGVYFVKIKSNDTTISKKLILK